MASPRDPAVRAHSRRVAAVATELAARAGLEGWERLAVRHLALLHHYPPEFMDAETVEFVLREAAGANWAGLRRADSAYRQRCENVRELVAAFHGRSALRADPRQALVVDLVAAADQLVQQIEAHPCEPNLRDRFLDRLRGRAEEGLCGPAVTRTFGSLPRIFAEELRGLLDRLPVFPAVALKVLALAAAEDITFSKLEAALSSDQVLAGHLISVANSCLYSPRQTISTIRQAISYIGLEATRKVAIAAAFHPLFASGNLKALWKHSLEAARAVEAMARADGRFHPEEAFLLGLVHDVGRLALSKIGEAAYGRLLEEGCEPVVAEVFLFGREHGRIGAEILRLWNFPEALAVAVEWHHEPEAGGSPLAAMLYLAEHRTASVEAPPLAVRLRQAEAALSGAAAQFEADDRERNFLNALTAVA
ncbi:MAG: HDOD domain-containing protein [Bryobacterales bacterium]|nr:HDOD domain-containing protein [Bryobacterales bacterium]